MTQAGGLSNSGTIFKYSLPTTIVVNAQPTDFTVCVGGITTFTTAASGTTNITYQWQYSPDGFIAYADISNVSGYSNATTSSLSVNTTGAFGAGRYRCRINGDFAAEQITQNEGLFIVPIPSLRRQMQPVVQYLPSPLLPRAAPMGSIAGTVLVLAGLLFPGKSIIPMLPQRFLLRPPTMSRSTMEIAKAHESR